MRSMARLHLVKNQEEIKDLESTEEEELEEYEDAYEDDLEEDAKELMGKIKKTIGLHD